MAFDSPITMGVAALTALQQTMTGKPVCSRKHYSRVKVHREDVLLARRVAYVATLALSTLANVKLRNKGVLPTTALSMPMGVQYPHKSLPLLILTIVAYTLAPRKDMRQYGVSVLAGVLEGIAIKLAMEVANRWANPRVIAKFGDEESRYNDA